MYADTKSDSKNEVYNNDDDNEQENVYALAMAVDAANESTLDIQSSKAVREDALEDMMDSESCKCCSCDNTCCNCCGCCPHLDVSIIAAFVITITICVLVSLGLIYYSMKNFESNVSVIVSAIVLGMLLVLTLLTSIRALTNSEVITSENFSDQDPLFAFYYTIIMHPFDTTYIIIRTCIKFALQLISVVQFLIQSCLTLAFVTIFSCFGMCNACEDSIDECMESLDDAYDDGDCIEVCTEDFDEHCAEDTKCESIEQYDRVYDKCCIILYNYFIKNCLKVAMIVVFGGILSVVLFYEGMQTYITT
jgi:hypothetical protein